MKLSSGFPVLFLLTGACFTLMLTTTISSYLYFGALFGTFSTRQARASHGNADSYLEEAIKFHKEQAIFRNGIFNSLSPEENFGRFYNALAIEAICPSKIRVGGLGDGGKWVCNPWKLPKNCVVYSLGLNDVVVFEEELQKIATNSCKIYGYDMKIQKPWTVSLYNAINGELRQGLVTSSGNHSFSNSIVIGEEVEERGNHHIDIFKIDIEGSEASVMPEFLNSTRPCQILIETHQNPQATYQLLSTISAADYWLYSYEINPGGFKFCEYSFIHEGCLAEFGALKLAKYLAL